MSVKPWEGGSCHDPFQPFLENIKKCGTGAQGGGRIVKHLTVNNASYVLWIPFLAGAIEVRVIRHIRVVNESKATILSTQT